MNEAKSSKLMRTSVMLTGITVSLFLYQNVIYPTWIEKDGLTTVYTAKKDIKMGTKLDVEMFETNEISAKNVLKGMITDTNDIKDKYLVAGLMEGEVLFDSRISPEKVDASQIYTIPFKSEYMTHVVPGDFISVYVKMEVENEGTVIRELFAKKEIVEGTNSTSAEDDSEGVVAVCIKVSEEEMKKYYLAQTKGVIIGVKIDSQDPIGGIAKPFDENEETTGSSEDGNNNSNSQEIDRESLEEEETGIMEYEVQEGDTLKSLALKFKTSESKIKSLNNNREEFEQGDMILVPAK